MLDLLDQEGVPRPRSQRVVKAGGRRRRLDFVYEAERVVIEADGYAHHSTAGSFERDRERNNSLTASGFLVLHWTWRALDERPEALVAELRLALASRARLTRG